MCRAYLITANLNYCFWCLVDALWMSRIVNVVKVFLRIHVPTPNDFACWEFKRLPIRFFNTRGSCEWEEWPGSLGLIQVPALEIMVELVRRWYIEIAAASGGVFPDQESFLLPFHFSVDCCIESNALWMYLICNIERDLSVVTNSLAMNHRTTQLLH